MATIKIKFKNTFTFPSKGVTYDVSFTSNGKQYTSFQIQFFTSPAVASYVWYNGDPNDVAYYKDSSEEKWANTAYQVIEIDPTQPNFQTFINAMKSNIEGVELEAGTYNWVDEPTIPAISFVAPFTFITTGSYDYIKISGDTSHIVYTDFDNDTTNAYTFSNKDWWNNTYKTITTTENQYVPYDFYNYAILGNQLVKQQPTPTSYTITDNLTNVSAAGSNVYQIDQGGTRSLTYSWSTQYVVGVNNINVVNADYTPTFSGNSVTLALSNPSGNVTINITASEGDFEFNITSNGTTTLATENTYVEHDIVFKVNVPSSPTETVEVALAMASGNQVITPSDGKTMTKVTVVKPSTFLPENIKKGVNIGYITGTYEGLIPDGTAVASNVRAGKTFYGNGTSKLTGTMQDYTGSTTIKSNGTMYTSGKYMPSNVVIDVPNPTLSGNAIASQVLKGQKFYSNSYTLLTGTMETYSGNTYITSNGVVATSGKYMNSDITVDVAGITEVATSAEMDTKLTEDNVSLYFKYTGTTDDKYTNGDIYQVQDEE